MNMTDEQIVESFHVMWDNFPEPVMLIKKSREIIAVNLKAAEFNLKPGSKCSSYGSPDQHRGCRCNEAVDNAKCVAVTYEGPMGKAFGYWIPVAAKPEWILHFSVGTTFEYESLGVPVQKIERF